MSTSESGRPQPTPQTQAAPQDQAAPQSQAGSAETRTDTSRTALVIAGSALLAASLTLLPTAFGWVDLPQPATALVSALAVVAVGVVLLAWRGQKARGLLVSAVLLAVFALPATGAAISTGPGWFGSHGGGWGNGNGGWGSVAEKSQTEDGTDESGTTGDNTDEGGADESGNGFGPWRGGGSPPWSDGGFGPWDSRDTNSNTDTNTEGDDQ